MSVVLAKGNGETFKVDGNEYYKGIAEIVRIPGSEFFNVSLDGSVTFANIPFSDFEDGDNADTPFTSVTELEEWVELNTFPLLPYPRPFRLVTDTTTNDILIKAGKTLLHQLNAIYTAESTLYVKIYDTASTPDATYTPIMVFPVVSKAEDVPTVLVNGTLELKYGLGIRITAALDDADETVTAADELVLSGIYQ